MSATFNSPSCLHILVTTDIKISTVKISTVKRQNVEKRVEK